MQPGPQPGAALLLLPASLGAQDDREQDGEDGGPSIPFDLLDPERVKRLPHVDDCQVCKLCIPEGKHHQQESGRAQQRRRQHARRRSRRLLRREHAALAARELPGWPAGTDGAPAAPGSERPGPVRAAARRLEQYAAAPAEGAAMRVAQLDSAKTHAQWASAHGSGAHGPSSRSGTPVDEVLVSYTNTSFVWGGRTYHIAPRDLVRAAGQIRNCPACRGCKDELRWMPKGVKMLGSHYAHEMGASPGWLLRVKTKKSRTGEAAMKVWCVPVKKPGATSAPSCKPDKIRHQMQLVLAQQRVAEDCGLMDVLPAHWVAPVDGVLPRSGYRVRWDALWSELAPGASLENLVSRGTPPANPAALLDLLQRRLSGDDAVAGAVFDLLTSQCDRHGQNVYVSKEGRLKLIDNDQAYGSSWRPCGVDSIFLPGTQKHEVARLGFKYVTKIPRDAPERNYSEAASPVQLLDYRCHAPGGKLGTNYPKQVTTCLESISSLTKQQVQRHYGFPSLSAAAALRRRASDMLSRGFEWTLKHGWPRNPLPMRYKWAPACCEMAGVQTRPEASPTYECMDWDRGHADLPRGEPYFGAEWSERAEDTGTYALGEADPGHKWPEGWTAGAWLGDDDGGPDPGYAPLVQANMYN